MSMKPVIDPEVLNALCGEPTSTTTQKIFSDIEDIKERVRRVEERLDNDEAQPQPQPQPQEEKKSFWGKVGNFFKTIFAGLAILPSVLNSISRFKDKFSLRRSPAITAI